ncbi:MAG: PEP-CTERM sorting domain-containing protein [Bryobacteraceae bacterium]|nr:PEP-CTERM sorting domain-containing protein [Bryobacteraceae bacterium]
MTALPAASHRISFNHDIVNPRPNFFNSTDSEMVLFSASQGADLRILNPGVQGNGTNGLAVFGDTPGHLILHFRSLASGVSMKVGNDEQMPGGYGRMVARLILYRGDVKVGQVELLLNCDDRLNQTISFEAGDGEFFDRAELMYAYEFGGGVDLIEYIDDVDFMLVAGDALGTPEPGTAMLLGAGLLLMGIAGRRRRSLRS